MKPLVLSKIMIIFILSLSFFHPAIVYGQSLDKDIMDLVQEAGYQPKMAYRPQASILIDATTGKVLWEDQPDLPWNPASIGKVMTLYLAFEAMAQGKFTLDTKVKATMNDQAISNIFELSNNKIIAGVEYPVSDLLYMMTTPSSNVATVMIANLIADNGPTAFIEKMNETAHALNMTNTIYYNCSGAPVSSFKGYYQVEGIDPKGDNVSSARDLAILTYHFLKNYPEILTFTSKSTVTVMEGTPYQETFSTYNYSLPDAEYGFKGVDGLKTGSSPSGGFNYIFTAKQNETRLIGVVLGVGNWSDQDGEYQRHPFGNGLLKYGFEHFEYKKLLKKGIHTINQQKIKLDEDFYGLINTNSSPTFQLNENKLILTNELQAVSSTITDPEITYQPVAESSVHKQTKALKNAGKNTLSITNVLFLSGICLFLIGSFLRKMTTGRHAKTIKWPKLFKIVGALFILSALGIFCYSTLLKLIT